MVYKKIIAGMLLVAVIALPTVAHGQEPLSGFSDSDLEAYKKLPQEKCLNIVINAYNDGVIYNGVPVGKDDIFPAFYYSNGFINGDRFGYVRLRGSNSHLFLDGIDMGPIANGRSTYAVTDNHVAYYKRVGATSPNEGGFAYPVYQLIVDGVPVGQEGVGTDPLQVRGDHIISFSNKNTGKTDAWGNPVFVRQMFVDGAMFDEDVLVGDYDGTHAAVVRGNSELYYDGKKVARLGTNPSVVVNDGHLAYESGNGSPMTNRISYDNKDKGFGTQPVIEGNHLGFSRYVANSPYNKFVYDGKEVGTLGGNFSLAGDHYAFIERGADGSARVNIDGKKYPGSLSGTVSVQITKKKGCGSDSALVPVPTSTMQTPVTVPQTVNQPVVAQPSTPAPVTSNPNPTTAVVAPSVPAPTSVAPTPVVASNVFKSRLAIGSRGNEVKALQEKLKALGFFPSSVASSGTFGPTTANALKKFQSANKLAPVGFVGPATRTALNSL